MKCINQLLSISLLTLFLFQEYTYAQTYQDYFGAGHNVGMSVSSSDESGDNLSVNSVNGTDLIPDLVGASRFLGQATLGANYEDIVHLSQIGVDAWLEEQIAIPATSYYDTYVDIYTESLNIIADTHGLTDLNDDRKFEYLDFTFYQKVLTEPDVLRHKIAFALSQIFVISINQTALNVRGFGNSSYYDVLYQGAFGNFRDLLMNVTLHPAMGIYLSHFQNKKADPIEGTLPDENFAREIMQLFTIGLFELNNDGSYKLNANGDLIPTYDINDIQELTKVFTGLSGSAWDYLNKPENIFLQLSFNKGINHYDLTKPMAMFEEFHDTGTKTLVDGTVLPAGQPGMDDINDAIDVLFNHPNVAPFISIRLIQQMVKSNPTPAYINRVASAFNDNGYGVRGDMQAIITAILTDPEARDCSWIDNPRSGKLKQPIERLTQLFRAFDINSPSGKLWFRDLNSHFPKVEQAFLGAPSVFNFFSPFYAESDYVEPNSMVSPEFQILNSTSGIHGINLLEASIKTRPFLNRTKSHETINRLDNNHDDEPFYDFTDEEAIYHPSNFMPLIDRLDLIICHGQLSDDVKNIIADAVYQYTLNGNAATAEDAIQEILYFMMMSPSYMILK